MAVMVLIRIKGSYGGMMMLKDGNIEAYVKSRLNEKSYDGAFENEKLDFNISLSFEDLSGKRYEGDNLTVVTGDGGTWTVDVVNNHGDVSLGTVFDFVSLNQSFAIKIQTDNPGGRDYTTITTNSDARLYLEPDVPGFRQMFKVFLISGTFKKGESFTIKIGDRSSGSPGSEIYWTATRARVIAGVDIDGSKRYFDTHVTPQVINLIHHHEPKNFRLLGPTVAKTGEPFDMHLGVFDRNGNIIEDYEGRVDIDNKDGLYINLPDFFVFSREDKGIKIFKNIYIEKEGVYRARIYPGKYLSNPVSVSCNPDFYVYWGDLHAHGWGDCTMYLMHLRNEKVDPLNRHMQAREVGRLDFSAIGPMSYPHVEREEIWEAYKYACEKTMEENKYVPFLSYEAHPAEGDRNVIFKNLDEKIPPDYRIPMEELDKEYGARDDVILQIHIGGSSPNWDRYRPERERMVEVSSGFGNAEWLLQKALNLGYKPAVCGASDLHMGLMGGIRTVETGRGRFFKLFKLRDSAYGTGPLTGAIAKGLTRNNIWDAFTKRLTYATSGARIYIDFKCNNRRMGSEIKREKLHISFKCCGTDIIDRVDLICGNYMVKSWFPNALDFDNSLTIGRDEIPGDWLYLRVHQADENYAWTSPVYVEGEYPFWNDDSDEKFNLIKDKEEAEKYIFDLMEYLKTEEEPEKFKDITPVGICVHQTGKCALFTCRYGEEIPRDMTIRWYFEYPIPKIRFDWGLRDFGIRDDWTNYRK